MGRSIVLLPLNNSNNNTSDDMAKLHTYIHATCTNLPSPVLSASMRDGVVVGYLLMKEDGWIGV